MPYVPPGWELVPLGELGKYINGRAFKPEDWESSGLPIVRIQNLTDVDSPYNYYSKPVEQRYYIKNGDLLISWSATLGAYIWNRGDAILNQHIFKVEENRERVDKFFLKYAVQYALEELSQHTHGTTMRHVTKGKFEAFKVPIPRSLAEQRRIVARIEALFAELRECQQTLGELRKETGRLMKAVLSETYDRLSQEHEVIETAQVCTSITDGNHITPQYVDSGVPFLFVSNVVNRYIDFNNTKFVTQEYYDGLTDSRKPEVGDILYTVVGSYGVPVEVNTPKPFCFQRHIGILKPDREKVYPGFLRWILDAPQVLKQAHEVVTGSAQKTLTLTYLRKLRFPCPESIKVQKETALQIESVYREINDMKQTQAADADNFAAMEQAVLNQAFRGEL
jgi:type I restriction enzyme S subunit